MRTLPHLEIVRVGPVFDEAVICIDGHEEETITIECNGAAELAERIIFLVDLARQIDNLAATATTVGVNVPSSPKVENQ